MLLCYSSHRTLTRLPIPSFSCYRASSFPWNRWTAWGKKKKNAGESITWSEMQKCSKEMVQMKAFYFSGTLCSSSLERGVGTLGHTFSRQRAKHAQCSDGTSRPGLTSRGDDPGWWWLLAKVDIRKRGWKVTAVSPRAVGQEGEARQHLPLPA